MSFHPRLISLCLFYCLGLAPFAPSLKAEERTVIGLAEWRFTLNDAQAEVSPKNPDFRRQLWNWADKFFHQAQAAGDDRASRRSGRVALLKWAVITSYIVELQGSVPLDGASGSRAAWEEQVRINRSMRKKADHVFGAVAVRASWDAFTIVCNERGWEPAKSPF